jgi:hypothetical protein
MATFAATKPFYGLPVMHPQPANEEELFFSNFTSF